MPENLERLLAAITPFKALPQKSLRALAAATESRMVRRGEDVYREGAAADSVWILQSGRVQIFKHVVDAKAFALETLGPGDLFGVLCRINEAGRRYPCTATAAAPSVALRIQGKAFFDCYKSNPGFVLGLCELCSQRLDDAMNLRRMDQESVPVRIASILIRLQKTHGPTIPLTKREVSEMTGTTVETTFRVLGKLEKKGVVVSTRGNILVEKPKELVLLAKKERRATSRSAPRSS